MGKKRYLSVMILLSLLAGTVFWNEEDLTEFIFGMNRTVSAGETIAVQAAAEAESGSIAVQAAAEAESGTTAVQAAAEKEPEVETELATAEELPAAWYAGDYGKAPAVKDQGAYGTCWAIAATYALESALLPSTQIIFSADHLTRQNAFTADLNDGGDYLMIMAYLCGWQGPVTEEEDPYGDGISPDGLSPAVHVQEVQVMFDSPIEKIKEIVYTYGSIQTSLYMDRTTAADDSGYYNSAASSYYYIEEMTQNHDVLILGWDDSWPADSFAAEPESDGAFICLNTWGDDFGEDGLFYVSYSDPNIGKVVVAYTRVEAVDNYDHLYQYDDCGWQGQQGYDAEECWFANVYTALGDETIAAVGFYATDVNTSYEIYLVHDFTGTESFDDMEYLQEGSFLEVGYYTVDLDQVQELAEGERFAVVVKICTPGASNPVAAEYHADEYTANVTTEGKESYLSQYGTVWENTQEKFETNVCLKVYTLDQ